MFKKSDHIVDYFGIDVEPENITENTFDVTVSVSISNPFFAWVAGFTGDMTIAGPADVKTAYIALSINRSFNSSLSSHHLTRMTRMIRM